MFGASSGVIVSSDSPGRARAPAVLMISSTPCTTASFTSSQGGNSIPGGAAPRTTASSTSSQGGNSIPGGAAHCTTASSTSSQGSNSMLVGSATAKSHSAKTSRSTGQIPAKPLTAVTRLY